MEDKSSKTELPSEYKLQKARQEGKAPKSQEVLTFGMCIGFVISVGIFASSIGKRFLIILSHTFSFDTNITADNIPYGQISIEITVLVILILLPITVISIILQYMQLGNWIFNFEHILPKLSRINPLDHIKRIFGDLPMELLKSSMKMVLITVICIAALYPYLKMNMHLMLNSNIQVFFIAMMHCIIIVTVCVIVISGIIGGLDYLFQRMKFMTSMMMSIHEKKEEIKSQEGNPETKARRSKIMKGMLKNVQKLQNAMNEATFTINNPTHFCVVMAYNQNKYQVPVLLAKGEDHDALHLLNMARKAKIPRVSSPAIARALYYNCTEGDIIDQKYYMAVAQIISYLEYEQYPNNDINLNHINAE